MALSCCGSFLYPSGLFFLSSPSLYEDSLTHISLAFHFWDISKQCRPRADAAELGVANSEDPDQTPSSAASDQGLHCLLTGISIRNRIKMKKYTRHP